MECGAIFHFVFHHIVVYSPVPIFIKQKKAQQVLPAFTMAGRFSTNDRGAFSSFLKLPVKEIGFNYYGE